MEESSNPIEEQITRVQALQEMLNEEIQKEQRNYANLLQAHEDYKKSTESEKNWYRGIIIALIIAMVAINGILLYHFFQYDFETITIEQKADSKDGGPASNTSNITK